MTTPGAATLSLDAVSKVFGAVTAVDGVSLAVPPGHLLGLLGPSGCGKTTVLRMVAGLVSVSSGTIRLDGQDLTARPPHTRDIGFVFQQYALFPHLTVAANVAFGLEMRKVPKAEIESRVAEALALVRLPSVATRMPRELSGGQQQRVALARALVIRPRLLLLDEPLSNLDARLRDELRSEIREIQRRLSITTVFVTHDQVEALTMCDTVGVMSQGRLIQVGTPEDIYERPASRLVAEFVGRITAMPCEVVSPGRIRVAGQELLAATGEVSPGPAVAMVRPHRVSVTADGASVSPGTNAMTGAVTRTTYVGDVVQHEVTVGPITLKADTPAGRHDASFRVGDRVTCGWSADDMRVFRD